MKVRSRTLVTALICLTLIAADCTNRPGSLGGRPSRRDLESCTISLTDVDAEVRRRAALDLGHIGDRRSAPVLALMLEDHDALVRAAAAEALGNIAEPSTVPAIAAALKDDDYIVRWDAVRALGRMKALSAIPAIEEALVGDARSEVRQAAVTALENMAAKEALAGLVRALDDKDESVVLAAEEALGRVTGKNFGVDRAAWRLWWKQESKSMEKPQ